MSTTLSGRVEVNSKITVNSSDPPNSGAVSAQVNHVTDYTDGTSDNQAQKVYCKKQTASGNTDLDLSGGGLLDPLGVAVSFTKVRGILVINHETTTGRNVVVGNAAANPFSAFLGGTTPSVNVPPGGKFLVEAPVDGWAVVNAASDTLRIATAGSYSFTVQIWGS